MKKFVAIALVLVLVLGLCATAFAGYYPTVKFSTKNKSFKYGKTITLKVKCYQGTGPFNKVWSSSDKEWIIITRLRGDQIKEMRHPQPLPHDQHEEKKLETKPKRKKHMAHPKEQIPSPREKREQKK